MKTDWSARFREWTLGDEPAAQFLDGWFAAVHLFDDVRDADKPIANEQLYRTLFWLLAEMPRNPFYKTAGEALSWVAQAYITQWFAANRLERSGDGDKIARAYGLRDAAIDMASHVAYICGGYDHMLKVNEEMYALACDETLDEFREKTKCLAQ